ncbi:hypothetical protein L207DRAFT_513366 [Hyaloscypha variabilis F]|uniref:Zn(2)-C6 fungal-type domain-containing protein n=1 Tax=Hyaloscypha variabilis (strain UAMH 11265 / GT02V1 / F) TaxID=1149755 RepID=A0A2J6RK52_HYAVF|nr:hypothetical protein L207DRAFT_513366 [Hyaloscypha variabilis F]
MNGMNIKPSARKTHRKTRTGCRTCKSRKIKCDEQRPSCHNCIKHSVVCDFVSHSVGGTSRSGRGSQIPTSPQNGSIGGGPTPDFSSDTPMSLHDVQSTQGLNLLDLELLHNYITSTANTLHTDPAMKSLWKINVPQLGFRYDFVMRGILALSALHLARYRPEKKELYNSQAMLQHQIGLRQATNVLTEINEENCTGVYIFSALTLFFTVATPRKPGDFLLVGDHGIADWLNLVKGTSFIVGTSENVLFNGSLGPMFIAGRRRNELREKLLAESSPDDSPLAELRQLIEKTTPDGEDVAIYLSALDSLRKSFVTYPETSQGPTFESADIFIWVFEVDHRFLELLRLRTQEALCIFSYFCVVLRRLDSYWWMEGWATHLIAKIYHLLDEEHRLWIRWPIEEIGWIPN